MTTPTHATHRLPDRPDLDQLRRQAREVARRSRNGDPDELAALTEQLGLPVHGPLPLHLAQLGLARSYGFPSWTRLVTQVHALEQHRSDPLDGLDRPAPDVLTDVLRSAVLLFGPPDGPSRWARAARLLAEHPELPAASVHAAAVAADPTALRAHLAADPRRALLPGGPFGWPPLLHLTYSRLGLVEGGPGAAGAADALTLLLAAGADPNTGFLWQGLPTPFTALTGLLGGGEGHQPPHPRVTELAPLLLRAGADANDGQALYNRMFGSSDDHLVLLFAHGLGQGDGGPWRRRLPDLTDSPADLLAGQLGWAVTHGLLDRIRLLAAHGVDLGSPLRPGPVPAALAVTPYALALRSGRPEVAELLSELGVRPGPDDESALVGLLLAGDRDGVRGRLALDPEAVSRLRRTSPSLVLRAAVAGRPEGVRLLAELGFDLDARGRQDLPLEQPWETALHHAAGEGRTELARLLLELGADPDVLDARFGQTPLGWARHFGREELVRLLEPVTAPPA